ncbi:MAG TPA: PLP-dependent aminotransferase family protein, partial [Caulobacteraceae bacterium]
MTTSATRPTQPAPQTETRSATVLLSVVLDRQSAEPLGRQLYLRIRDLILQGRLAPGSRLPSSRRLADDLGVSRAVPLAAYDQLAAEGYVEGRRGSGQYVGALEPAKPLARTAASQRPAPVPAAESLADDLSLRGHPFDPDAPAWDLFPRHDWTRLMARGWRLHGADATSYGLWAGLPALRAAIAGHLRILQGLEYRADNVAITAGNADALHLIARALAPPGAPVWVEDPGHRGARRALRRDGLKVTPVPVDAEGIIVGAGRRLAPRAALALVTPARQFPMGAPLSLA